MLRVGHLQLGQRVAHWRGVRPSCGSTSGSSARAPSIAIAHLLEVALVLGAGRRARPARAEVEQRHERLEQHVLDAQMRFISAS